MIDIKEQLNPAQEKSGSQMPVPVSTVKLYSYRDLCRAGKSFVFDRENRETKSKNLDAIKKGLKGKNKFIESMKVTPATLALKQGCNLMDYESRTVDSQTQGIENMYVILDGQHRNALMIEDPELDCNVEIVEPENIKDYIDTINNYRKSWDGNDVRHTVSQANPELAPILDAIKQFSEYWGVSLKYAECALTGNVDRFKLGTLKKIQWGNSQVDVEKFKVSKNAIANANEMMKMLYSVFVTPEERKMVKKLDLMQAIKGIQNSLSDEKAADFDKNVMGFIQSFKERGDKTILFEGIGSKVQYNQHVMKLWNQTNESHDMAVLCENAKKTVTSYTHNNVEKPVSMGTTKAVLKARELKQSSKKTSKNKQAKEEVGAVTPPIADLIPVVQEEEDPKTVEDVLAGVLVDGTNKPNN